MIDAEHPGIVFTRRSVKMRERFLEKMGKP
jgi:hypothetical protein